jgi:nicotinamidase-related amidase
MKSRFTTLFIVDVQKAFPVPPAWLERLRHYAARFDRRVFTRFVNPSGSPFRRHLAQRCCAPGSADLELMVAPQPGDLVIDKASYGLPPAALRKIKRLRITEATIAGIDTDACVLGVMFSLFDAGIRCRASAPHCRSSTGLQGAALKIIQNQFELLPGNGSGGE